MTSDAPEESPLIEHAKSELQRVGLMLPDSDYDGMLGKAALELIETFASQGHSGMSAQVVAGLFSTLVQFKPLSPLTNDPDEWMQVHEGMLDPAEPPLWQNKRDPAAFSNDGGGSYYLVNEKVAGVTPTVYQSAPAHPELIKEITDDA